MDATARLALELDPSLVLDMVGLEPLDWQRHLFRSKSEKVLLNCHRQAGKSSATACLACLTALREPGSLCLIVSASQRQSSELLRKVRGYWKSLGTPAPATEDSAVSLTLGDDGSRIVSLPDNLDSIVCYSAPRLIIIDEAARVSDETYLGVRPMLVRSHGRMVLMSTPRGRRGFFYEAWNDQTTTWDRVEYPVTENMHIDKEWLDEERRLLGPRWFAQEYLCSFEENQDQCFPTEAVLAAFNSDRPPLLSRSYFQ